MSIRGRLSLQRGITLVEQIIFIIVVSVGVVGVLSTMGPALRFSADPQVRKQQLAIAESLLSEILHQPFTYCDPDDANAGTATLSGATPSCADPIADQNRGGAALTSASPHSASVTEGRFGVDPGTQFDNVADYGGYVQNNVTDIQQSQTLNGFSTRVDIVRIGANYSYGGVALPDGAALQISVTVSGGSTEPLTLTGYRFRYAPRY